MVIETKTLNNIDQRKMQKENWFKYILKRLLWFYITQKNIEEQRKTKKINLEDTDWKKWLMVEHVFDM